MQWRNTEWRYGAVHKSLHWGMAVLILGMLTIGLYMTGMPLNPDRFRIYGLHKATGMAILALAGLRLAWRLSQTVPKLPEGMPRLMQWGAHASHFALYALMFLMPLTGWLMSAYAGLPVSFYGWFTIPNPVAPDDGLRRFMHDAHELLAWALIGVIALHAGAALYHHFIRKDETLKRMLPCARP